MASQLGPDKGTRKTPGQPDYRGSLGTAQAVTEPGPCWSQKVKDLGGGQSLCPKQQGCEAGQAGQRQNLRARSRGACRPREQHLQRQRPVCWG